MRFWGFIPVFCTSNSEISFQEDQIILFINELIQCSLQIIDIMWDKVGRQCKVLVQRAHNVSVILTVTPEEADDQQLSA
jgi:hypothetical protein